MLVVVWRPTVALSQATEFLTLRWDHIDHKVGLLHIARLQNSLASTYPICGPELLALREPGLDAPAVQLFLDTRKAVRIRIAHRQNRDRLNRAEFPLDLRHCVAHLGQELLDCGLERHGRGRVTDRDGGQDAVLGPHGDRDARLF